MWSLYLEAYSRFIFLAFIIEFLTYYVTLLLLSDLSYYCHYDYFLNRFLLTQADFGLVTCKADEGVHLLMFLHYSDFRHRRPQHLCQTSYFVF